MEKLQREIYRYLGYRGSEPGEQVRALVDNCLEELRKVSRPQFLWRSFPLAQLSESVLNLTCFQVSSRDLVKNLSGCSQVLLFAATLGMGPDQQIQKYSRLETSRAVILQAAAAALIESVCDEKNEELRLYYEGEGYFLRPRFSPGYGDFSISYQRDLLDALQASKFAGITLTEGYLMMPSKSVTAVIGVSRTSCRHVLMGRGCDSCTQQTCIYRRN